MTPVDVPVGRQLEKGTPAVQRAARAQISSAETLKAPVTVPIVPVTPNVSQAPQQKLDREMVIALAKQHMPEVVRGDTAPSYAVIVLDADQKYVWRTYGLGTLQLVIGGDKRTPAERSAANREMVGGAASVAMDSTIRGRYAIARSGTGGTGGTGDTVRGGVIDANAYRIMTLRDSMQRAILRLDTAARATGIGAGGGTGGGVARGGGGGGGAGTGGAIAVAGGGGRGGGVARAGGGGGSGFNNAGLDSGSYYFGGSRASESSAGLNSAAGLQAPLKGESGIQGLSARSLTMGVSFNFPAGQLAPHALRIYVVQLAPGTNWKGR